MKFFATIVTITCAVWVLFMPLLSYAQSGVFGSSVQKIPSIQFERNNKYMADILSLQNQIALLEKLIDRQKELNEMASNLAAMNMPFVPPAPEYEICEQLPGNDLCAEFYPDLYQGYQTLAAAMPPPLPLPNLSKKVVANLPIQNISELDRDVVKQLEEADFQWAEINCLNDVCKAIVTPNADDNQARYTIRIGDRLPNGMVVESISAKGVVTSRGSKTTTLEPAPSSTTLKENVS